MPDNVHGQEIESIRDGVVMDLINLEHYLKKNQLILKSPIEIRQFKMGQSNPTFLIVDASKKTMVIRKRPPGELLAKSAHAIDREYRILYALGRNTQVPVPKVFHYCFDINIIGTEFYVMEFLKGRIFADVQLPTVDLNAKHAYYKAIIEALVQLHSIDFSLIGLDNYGKKGNYYKRQIKSLFNISKKQGAVTGNDGIAVGDLNHLNDMVVWLHNNAVRDEVTLVHGDFKTDNIIFHPESNKVIGILDWELSTIGHPLSDLANLLLPWYVPSKWGKLGGLADLPRPLGIPEADVLIKQYCIARNIPYPIPNWHFCIAFAFFRLAVITQGIAARVKRNQASSGIAEQIAKLFQPCAEKFSPSAYMKLWFLSVACLYAQKMQLKDVKSMTFYYDRWTTGKRTAPVLQLDCVGGDACSLSNYLPTVVQCQNVGMNGYEVQWKCTAELDDNVRLGETTVVCEGYNSRDDKYVLQGSCSLEYKLYTTRKYRERKREETYRWDFESKLKKMRATQDLPGPEKFIIIVYITWAIMAVILILHCCSRRNSIGENSFRPDNQYQQVPNANPPPYTKYFDHQRSNSNRPGFWSGFISGGAAGHLLAYLSGRMNTYRRDGNFGLGRSVRADHYPSSSSTTRTSTGYGGSKNSEETGSSSGASTAYGGTRRR